jgi:formate dehydrogenase beta subunit
MNTVAFSSWDGRVADHRKGKPAKAADVKFPEKINGRTFSAVIGWNGIVARDASADIPSLTMAYLKEARKLSCGECSVCMIGIDKVTDIMRIMATGKGFKEGLAEIEEIARGVAANSKCNFGRASALTPVLDAIRYFKDDFVALATGKRRLADKAYSTAVTAPCMEACPATLDIPGYIELIRNNKFLESLNLIRERCILPGVIGRACTHPCEGACVRKDIDQTLAIRLLKRAAADDVLAKGDGAMAGPDRPKKDKVAVVGAGPAGLAAAYHLRRLGYQVTLFEALPKAGGMAVVGIPDYRLPKDILNGEIGLIEKMGVEIKLNSKISRLDWEAMKADGYRALFLAVGAHVGARIGCGGEDSGHRDFIQGALFLRNLALGKKVAPRDKVVIIGGGNVALDCARSCVRLRFKEVEILYRRSRAEMPASKEEIKEAEEEGVKFTYLRAPKNVLFRGGKVAEIECIKMKLGAPDASGRKRPIAIPGSEYTLKTDMVIAATGQTPDLDFLKNYWFELTGWGTIQVDLAGYGTNVPGVFAGGDCVSGPATLIEALDAGNRAARSIDSCLQGKSASKDFSFKEIDTGKQREHGFVSKTAAEKVAFRAVSDRVRTFDEVENGFTAKEAMKEAQRCLRCYRLMVWE